VERRLRSELVGVGVLFAIGLATRTAVLYGIDDGAWRGFVNLWLPARLDHFAFGMLLAIASVHFRELGHEPSWARAPWLPWASWAVAGAAFWYLTFGFGLDDIRGPARFSHGQEWLLLTLWGVVGATMVAPAVFGPQRAGAIRALLRLRPLAWLGTISYGIYLWHEAALDLYPHITDKPVFFMPFARTTAFMFAVTIPVAAASYYLVERPALSLKHRPIGEWLRRRPAGAPG
jgi:peptidoglycan/LPS O-acetylase OafA/YrhL